MPVNILMPTIAPGIDNARLTRWLVAEGARILHGDVIAEIETDTATMEIEASQSGTLLRLIVPAGPAQLAAGTPIADIEPDTDAAPRADGGQAYSGQADGRIRPAPQDTPPRELEAATAPSGSGDRSVQLPARHPISPAARALAQEARIDVQAIDGTGPGGRVLKTDVEARIAELAGMLQPASDPPRPATGAGTAGSAEALAPDKASAASSTAQQPLADAPAALNQHAAAPSPMSAPPTLVMVIDCRIDELLRTRDRINLAAPPRNGSVREKTLATFYVRAAHLALALRDAPFEPPGSSAAAASSGRLTYARMTANGLDTRHFTTATLQDIEAIAEEFAASRPAQTAAGNQNSAAPDRPSPAGITVLDLGTFRIQRAHGMIGPNDDVLLAIGASERRPAASGERISIATVVTVTMTINAQRIDPATAAASLEHFRALLEAPRGLTSDHRPAPDRLR